MNHGVYVSQQATSVSTPVVAESGVPFVVGLAPVQAADKPAAPGTPVLCTSWSEAVEKLGYSDDWATYTLCEFMYSHFKLFACQPVIFCNVLDIATAKEASAATDVAVTEHKVKLPIAAINDSTLVIKPAGGTGSAYVSGTDYNAYYSGEHLVVELLSTGSAYDAEQVNIAYNKVKACFANFCGGSCSWLVLLPIVFFKAALGNAAVGVAVVKTQIDRRIFIVLGEEVNQLAGRHRSADLVDAVTLAESRTNQLFHCRRSFLKI